MLDFHPQIISITCSGIPQPVEALGLPFSVFSPSGVGDIPTTAIFPWATITSSIMHEVSFPSAPTPVQNKVRFSAKLTPKQGEKVAFY